MTDDRTSPVPAEPRPGATLAAARRERGLSVEDVAAATRIRVQLVNEIEQDDYAGCGGAIYARGHIRAIAQVVGADGDELVGLFDRQHGGAPVPTIAPAALPALTVPPAADRRMANAGSSSPRWASAAIAVLAVAAVFLGVTWFVGRAADSPQQTAEPPVHTRSAAPSDSPTPTPTPTPTAVTPTPTPTPQGVTVRVQVTGAQSWVRVQSSTEEELFSGVLDAGAAMEWRDPQLLTLRFGNATAVHVLVNGRDVGQPCDTQVCTVRFPASADTAG